MFKRKKNKSKNKIFNLIKTKSWADLGKVVTNILKLQVLTKKNSVIGINSSINFEPIYNAIITEGNSKRLDLGKVKFFTTEEFKEMGRHNFGSIFKFMNKHLFLPANIKSENIFTPSPIGSIRENDYDITIYEHGSFDVGIFELGPHGEMGYCSEWIEKKATDYCKLSPINSFKRTMIAKWYPSNLPVPSEIYSIGVGAILASKHIVLIVNNLNLYWTLNNIMVDINNKDKVLDRYFVAGLLAKHEHVSIILGPEISYLFDK